MHIHSQREKTPSWPIAVLTNFCPSKEDLHHNRPWLMLQTLKWEQSSWKTSCRSSNKNFKSIRKYLKLRRTRYNIFKIRLHASLEMTTKNSHRLIKVRRETQRDSSPKNSSTHLVNRSSWHRIGLKLMSHSNCCLALYKKSRMRTMRWSRRFTVLRRVTRPTRKTQRKILYQGHQKSRIRSSRTVWLEATEENWSLSRME